MGAKAQKPTWIIVGIVFSFLLTYVIIFSLSVIKSTTEPYVLLSKIALSFFAFLIPITIAWLVSGILGGLATALFASILVFFVGSVAATTIFIWFLPLYGILIGFLYYLDMSVQDDLSLLSVDEEKVHNDKNNLEVSFKQKGEGISILFEKYSTYYNLRKLAEDLASSLVVNHLARTVIEKCYSFIPKGNLIVLSIATVDGAHLSPIAYDFHPTLAEKDSKKHQIPPEMDMFDHWIIKNRRRLIVADTQQDFRFDISEASKNTQLRSLIIAALQHEGRVIGTLRMNSIKPDTFSNDDLRLLDTIAVLASSALSNAMLYEQTEELAIRDSLTGLYVRRYFYDRLKEEHKRALLTHKTLSLIMADLDYFKKCNDRYGHAAGDLMLSRFASILKEIGELGIVARYGGEEFAILLPEASKIEAFEIAEKIRLRVEGAPFTVRREQISMTVSMGVSSLPDDTLDFEELIHKADIALYKAKNSGRNRVCISES